MKKLQFMMLAAGMFAVASCSNDDSSNGGNVSSNLEGTYELTSMTSAQSQDYDGDGDSSTDLVTEGSCYNSSWIAFHANGTYDEGFTSSKSADGGTKIDCETSLSSGTYTRNGDNITTTRTSGSGEASATFDFDSETKTLTRTDSDSSFPVWNAATTLWSEVSGSVNLTYKKYTNNDHSNGAGQDDDDNIDASAMAKLVGEFDMTSFIVAAAQDLDNNGQSSNNLVTESTCYSDGMIKFNNNGTYSETIKTTTLGAGALTLDCNTETRTGTYTRNGNKIVTRRVVGGVNVNTSYDYNASANTVSRTENNMQYPGFSSITSLFTQLSGDVDLTYTKG